MEPPARIGLIAGGGRAPVELIDACQQSGKEIFVICLEGQADEACLTTAPKVTVPLGGFGRFVETVKEQGITHLVMLGHVRRPSLTELKPDWHAARILAKIGFGALGDDGLLTAVGKALEEETGAKVIGAHEVVEDLLMPAGCLTKAQPDDAAWQDIQRGITVVHQLGFLDIGQSVIVQQGLVLGVEAIEGTDALIARCGALQRNGVRGILVKAAKPQQDHRFDLPSIGPNTMHEVAAAGLRGVALQAGHGLLVGREKAIDFADAAGLFLVGWEDAEL